MTPQVLRFSFGGSVFRIRERAGLGLVETRQFDFLGNSHGLDGIHNLEDNERHAKRIDGAECGAAELQQELTGIPVQQPRNALTRGSEVRGSANAVPTYRSRRVTNRE